MELCDTKHLYNFANIWATKEISSYTKYYLSISAHWITKFNNGFKWSHLHYKGK